MFLATIGIRIILCTKSSYHVNYFNYYFDIFLIIGIIGLTIVTMTNKKYVEISLTTLIIILILGTFKLVKFSLAFRLNFGIISIPDFILLLVLIYKRRNEILDIKEKWFSENDEERAIQEQFLAHIEGYLVGPIINFTGYSWR